MNIFSFLFIRKEKIKPLELFPDAVFVFDSEYKIAEYNSYAKQLFNLEEKNLNELKVPELFDCDFDLLLNELVEEGNICTLKIKDTDTFLEIKASRNDENNTYFSMRDVTQKHKTVTSFMLEYETSKKINRTKNNLLVKLGDEITSPLHSITGFSQAMLEGLTGKIDAKQTRYLNIINKNAYDLLNFLEMLIEGAKLESNSYEFDPKTFDVISTVNNVFTEIKEKNRNIKTHIDFTNLEKRSIYTDEAVLKKILHYLIANLVKSVEYSEITINLESPEREYVEKEGFIVGEDYQPKNFMHAEILSATDCSSSQNELSMFEIYPQLENNAKREVLNNLPLYNASLLGKYLKIKISAKTEGKTGFDLLLNIENP